MVGSENQELSESLRESGQHRGRIESWESSPGIQSSSSEWRQELNMWSRVLIRTGV